MCAAIVERINVKINLDEGDETAELYEKMSNKIYTPAPHVDTHDFDTKFQQGTSAAEYLVRYTTKIKNLGQDELESFTNRKMRMGLLQSLFLLVFVSGPLDPRYPGSMLVHQRGVDPIILITGRPKSHTITGSDQVPMTTSGQ
ncbi:hypothetical protein KCU64_g2624, partial [Aureobasidium melanogenum]